MNGSSHIYEWSKLTLVKRTYVDETKYKLPVSPYCVMKHKEEVYFWKYF